MFDPIIRNAGIAVMRKIAPNPKRRNVTLNIEKEKKRKF